MEAKEKSFGQIMQRANVFKIPFFQRAYVWDKEKHLKKFFDDLYESFKSKNEHFLGSVILKVSSGSDNYVSVIDGQQRLTTFSILMKVLYDNLEESNKNFFRDCLFEAYKNDNSPRIIHSKLDKESYVRIFNQSEDIEPLKTDNKIIVCYQFFSQQIKEKNMKINDIFEFIKFLKDSKILVEVCLDSKEDEQKIFDSINSTGEPLSSTDIIKNALFDKIIKESGEEKAIKLYERWQSAFGEDKEEENNFWNTRVGKEQRYKSEIFLHALAVIEGFFDYSKKHNISHLASLYKEYIKNFDSNKLENFLQRIENFSKIYRNFPQIIDTKDEKTLFNFDDWKLRLFHIIDEYNINTTLPLLLKLEYQLKDDKNLEQCFKLLEILLLCNTQTKSYNIFFARLTRELPKDNEEIYKYLKQEITKDYKDNPSDIKEWLNYISNKDAKIILFWIELYREFKDRDYKDKTIGLHYEYQLEHLMPQSWQQYWNNITDEENANRLIYQIGNMTLLKGKLNNELKNREWLIKLNGNGKARNYISKNADLSINKELLDKTEWNEKEITKRTNCFIEEFFKIWNVDILTKD